MVTVDVVKTCRDFGLTPQSRFDILQAGLDIVKIFNPKSILEIGFGKGDWSIITSYILSNPSLNVYGIENFSAIQNGIQNNTEEGNWPDNIEKLNSYIETRKQEVGIENSFKIVEGDILNGIDQLLEPLNTKFDCIRLDCLCQHKEQIKEVLESCLKFTTSEFLLLVDDAGPNQCGNRFIACTDLVEEDKFKPLWYSSDEVAFTNIEFDTDSFMEKFDSIYPKHHYKIRPTIHYFYNGHKKQMDFIRTISLNP